MFVSGALSIGFVFSQLLSEHYGSFKNESTNKNIALTIALAIVANSAQLNFFNEGFYPQIMSTTMLGLVLVIFMLLRHRDIHEIGYLEGQNLREKIQTILLLAILFGAIAITYSEALLLGIAFLVGLFLLDLIAFDKYRMRCDLLVAMGIFLGLLLAFPVTKELIVFTLEASNNISAVGYLQPSAMFPSELVGVGSIYANIAQYLDTDLPFHIVKRSNIELIVGGCASLLIAYFIFRGALFLRDMNFLLTAVFGIIAFFVTNYWLSRDGYMPANYAYNKLSSILSVFLIGLVVVGIRLVNPESKSKDRIIFHRVGLALFICIVFVTSIFTLKDSHNYRVNIDMQSTDQLNRQLIGCNCALLSTERGRRGDTLIGQLRYIDRIADFFMSTMFSVPMLDQWTIAKWHLFAGDETSLYLIIHKDYIFPQRINYSRVVATSRSYLVLDAKITVGELKRKSGLELAKWINDELGK
jgi:hypothetical protein